MNGTTRGIRNAFRNVIRSVSITVILGLSVGLALSMLIANQAVKQKIESVKSSVGNTVTVSPAGIRGFEGGGSALTQTQMDKISALAHVTAINETLSDRLSSSDTDLESAIELGNFGGRFAENSSNSSSSSSSNSSSSAQTPPDFADRGSQITVVGTTNPTDLSSTMGGGTFTLSSGRVFASNSSASVAVLGKAIASKNDLKVGSTFKAYGKTITVVGIFDGGNTFANNQVLMPLKTVQTLSDQVGQVNSAVVTIDSVTNVTGVSKTISSTLGSDSVDVTSSVETTEAAISSLKNIQTISLYSLIGAVVAGAVIILLTMIMIVRERRREIGVFKAIGASNVKVMWQFMSEAITLTLAGALVGIALGVVAAKPITNMLVTNNTATSTSTSQGPGGGPPSSTGSGGATQSQSRPGFGFGGRAANFVGGSISDINANVGWSIIADGLIVALIIAVAGSGVATLFIAKVRPAEVMRSE
ncbi:FtsX-like permease family protein [Candidatus Saccharibacteria bacterium]|nr:FtsX-like permease family protein [Candidatus Saccharibacteria bacterium]